MDAARISEVLYGSPADNLAKSIDARPVASAEATHFNARDDLRERLAGELAAFNLGTHDAQVVINAVAGGLNQPQPTRRRMDLAEDNLRALHQRHGDDLDGALRAMQARLAKTPKLRDLLERSGAGNDLEVLNTLIAGTRRAR